MSRSFRIVVPGLPHHVIQRGGRRQKIFFSNADHALYLSLLKECCFQHCVQIWAYCLMRNHVHLVLVPSTEDALAKAVGQAHWRYAIIINRRKEWKGHLWQGRFSSFVMDERHLYNVVRYVELNPVRAGMVRKAVDHTWSSAKAHTFRSANKILDHLPLLDEISDWSVYLREGQEEKELRLLRRHLSAEKPLGDRDFVEQLSNKFGLDLSMGKPGRKTIKLVTDT
jgi:putative transposase